jgi:hypothetical protein
MVTLAAAGTKSTHPRTDNLFLDIAHQAAVVSFEIVVKSGSSEVGQRSLVVSIGSYQQFV